MDDEVRDQLESMTRDRAWLLKATERYPDLRIYRPGSQVRYCSPSVNRVADEFDIKNMVERHLMPGQAPFQSNVAVWCFTEFEGGRVHAWPPCFVIGGVDDPGTTLEERHLMPNWSTQLRDANIPEALIRQIDDATSTYPVADDDELAWRDGDEHHSVWTAQDGDGDVVGALRVHETANLDAMYAIRTRAECHGINICSHDGGFTIRTAQDFQAFIDDTVAFMKERDADRAEKEPGREAA